MQTVPLAGKALLALALIGGLFGAATVLPQTPYSEAASIAQGVASFEELTERFVALAEQKGSVYAFEVMRQAPLPPNTDIHLLGHAVGDEHYKQAGVGGIADCTQDFRNACSHSVVIGALEEFGQAALPLIREACLNAPGGGGAYTMCFHGLGHGVFAYFGYSLPETVEFCKKTGTAEYHEREYIECVGGAVMELVGGGGHDRELWFAARERYIAEDPLSPCLDEVIPEVARGVCINYITPQLWDAVGISLGNPDPTRFAEAFELCEKIPLSDTPLRQACYGGFGKEFIPLVGARDTRDVASFSDEQFRTALEWCTYAAADDGKRMCAAEEVASVFWGGENDPQAAFRFCGLATGDLQPACWERLANDIRSFTKDARRDELCLAVPEAYRGACLPS